MNHSIHYPATTQTAPFSARVDRRAGRPFEAGTWLILLVPLVAGIASIKGLYVGGVNYVLPLLMFFAPAAVALVVVAKAFHKQRLIAIPFFHVWLIAAAFVWLSLLWCDGATKHHFEHAFFYTSPLAVGAAAAVFIQTEFQLSCLLRAFVGALAGVCLLLFAVALGVLEIGSEVDGPAVDRRPLALTIVLIGCVFVTSDRRGGMCGWFVCVVLTLVTGSRMASMALLAALMARPTRRRLASSLGSFVLLLVVAATVFCVPSVRERFLGPDVASVGGTLEEGIDSSGRAEAWPLIWREAWKHPVIGAGVGSTVDFVPRVWERMQSPHNDFLRVFFEFGVVGVGMFVTLAVLQLRNLRRHMETSEGVLRWAFAAAWLGLLTMLLAAWTDNPLGYSLRLTNPLFALIGAAYGVAFAQRTEQGFHSASSSILNDREN